MADTPASQDDKPTSRPVPTIACEICQAQMRSEDLACPGCGRAITAQDRAVLQVKTEGSDHLVFERGRRMRKASNWIGILAVLLAISAVFTFFSEAGHSAAAQRQLAAFADDQPIDGTAYTAGQQRARLAREPYLVLGFGLMVAVVMGLFWWWARRAPLPAIGSAIALLVVIQVVSAVIDPKTLLTGIIVKIFAFVALGSGLKAALAGRAEARRAT
jgi:hypothetical protein